MCLIVLELKKNSFHSFVQFRFSFITSGFFIVRESGFIVKNVVGNTDRTNPRANADAVATQHVRNTCRMPQPAHAAAEIQLMTLHAVPPPLCTDVARHGGWDL